MKVLYVIEGISAHGGLERILTDKINALAEDASMQVSLLTVWQDVEPSAYALSEGVEQHCLGFPCPSSSLGMLCTLPRVLLAYNREVKRLNPDVVVYFRAVGAFLAAFSSWRGHNVFEAHLARRHSNHTWLYPLMERRVDAVVCLTRQDALHYGRAGNVEVIPNFTTLFCPPEKLLSCRSQTRKRCVFVGRLCREKNPLRLLRLWKQIVERQPDWHLDIYGGGELENRVGQEIHRLGIEQSVSLHGFVSDVVSVYASADVLLLTSVAEGLPMVIIEAMKCALPVVSTDCPYGPADIIEHGRTGFLVPLDDDAAYVETVCSLMSDGELRQRMGMEARRASVKFGKDQIISRWKTLFADLCKENEA